jgi:hypothetical protein
VAALGAAFAAASSWWCADGVHFLDTRMLNTRRSVAGLCIAIVALAALVPGLAVLDYALFEPQFVLLLNDTPAAFCPAPAPCTERPQPLRSPLVSRGPPSFSGF